ncbi:methyltransferase domain-containing protein [Ornithinimicrobium sp.]|uniref:methyltransferase domain-containing protein n=1 Tax=Ornithinimicrobium sp. TaxID=1977084 RepID=UPI0034CF4396
MTMLPSRLATRSEKVVCFIVRDEHLLAFVHLDHPLEQTGVQVPAGTLNQGEDAAGGALREATEESGLAGLRVVTFLGEDDYDLRPQREEVMHRRFFLLEVEEGAPVDLAARWEHADPDPTGGGAAPRWECFWLPLSDAHVLSCAQSRFVGTASQVMSAATQSQRAPVDRTAVEPVAGDHASTLWPGISHPEHSLRYVERFRSMSALGEDIEGESRLIDVLAPRGARLLDAGCGSGRHGGHLARLGHRVVGVDLDPVLIEAARADHPSATWLVADLVTLDLEALGEPEPFDGALLAGNVMDFVSPCLRAEALRRIAAHVAPGGFVVVGCRVTRGFTPAELDSACSAALLSLEQRFATWDLQPWTPTADFCVSVLRKDGS